MIHEYRKTWHRSSIHWLCDGEIVYAITFMKYKSKHFQYLSERNVANAEHAEPRETNK